MLSATATQRIISALPIWSLQATNKHSRRLWGLVKNSLKDANRTSPAPPAEEAQKFTIEKCNSCFFLQNLPWNGCKGGNKEICADLTSIVISLISPYLEMHGSHGCWLLCPTTAASSLPLFWSSLRVLDMRSSYNKIFLASLSGLILVFLTVKTGMKPNKFGKNQFRGNIN